MSNLPVCPGCNQQDKVERVGQPRELGANVDQAVDNPLADFWCGRCVSWCSAIPVNVVKEDVSERSNSTSEEPAPKPKRGRERKEAKG